MIVRYPRQSPAARAALVLLVLVSLLLHDMLLGRAVRAQVPPPEQVVAAAVQAFRAERTTPDGVLAVAVARQHRMRPGLSPQAVDRRAERISDSYADNGAAASRPFPSASMVKLFMAEDILHRARTGDLVLDGEDYDLLRRMLRRSDDDAASRLWVRYGGNRMVLDTARRYDLPGTGPTPVPGQWGQVTTTASDLARFLSLVPVVAHPVDAAMFFGWLRDATPVAADGFDQRFGLFGAVEGETAVKQGWMCCVDDRRHVHSVGVVDRTVVVLLSELPPTVGYDAARAALSAAATGAQEVQRP